MTNLPRSAWAVGLMGVLGLVGTAGGAEEDQPRAVFLTWQRDPTTTMTVDWHTTGDEGRTPALEYRPAGDGDWRRAEGRSQPFPFSDRTIHRVELTGLEPDAAYEFRTGPDERTYRFRTMPARLERPLTIAVGGDTMHKPEMLAEANRTAMKYRPDFILWGGDLAYANGEEKNVGRWHDWFDTIQETLIADDGTVTPIVVAIGNHEVRGGTFAKHDDFEPTDDWRSKIAPYFYELFAFPGQPGYGVLDFGDYLSVIALDTNHTNPIEGPQTDWLAEILADREGVPHVFPIYHVPAYPSHRGYTGSTSRQVRERWVPLFERHGIEVAFENHDHTYKRTHPIRGGKVDPSGIVYLGDGAWGVGEREGDSFGEWYIAEAASKRHVIIATLDADGRRFEMVESGGEVFDRYPPAEVGAGAP